MVNFDRIAPWYDLLVQMVFGNRIRQAQIKLLDAIAAPQRLLVIGGGTGWILDEIVARFPHTQIVYIDSSIKMIDLARERATRNGAQVTFRHGTGEALCDADAFDAILTPFFLDLFTDDGLQEVGRRLDRVLSSGGKWLFVDFCLPENHFRPLASLLIRLMYAFFSLTSKVEAKKLPDYHICFPPDHYQPIFTCYLTGGLIETKIFLKN